MKARQNAFLPFYNADRFDHSTDDSEKLSCLIFSTVEEVEDWILVGQAEITMDAPDRIHTTELQVQWLKKKKQSLQAEAQHKINQIDHQINQLLCLESK